MFSELPSDPNPFKPFLESSLKINLSLFGETYLLELAGLAGNSSLLGEFPPRDDSPTFFYMYFL